MDATVTLTVPSPVPLAPDVIVSHEALLVAVHGQVDPAETVTVTGPPLAATVWVVGATTNVQLGGGDAVCVTVNV